MGCRVLPPGMNGSREAAAQRCARWQREGRPQPENNAATETGDVCLFELSLRQKKTDMYNIPENVVAAAIGLLSPFVPDLTPDALTKKLSVDVVEKDKVTRPEYTRREAASRLGVALRTIDNYLSNGTLKARKIGRKRVLIPADGIEALLSGEYGREVTE